MNVSVLGLGYIGLPTAALLADAGHTVFGYDVDPAVCSRIAAGTIDTTEPDVAELVRNTLANGEFSVGTKLLPAEAYIICVPTPTVNKRPDLRYVASAAAAVAEIAKPGSIVILESTVPPNTTFEVISEALAAAGKRAEEFHIAHCPERVIPGSTLREMRFNARVIGGRTIADAVLVKDLYESFCYGEIHVTEIAVAEFVKVVENTYRDVNIAFANELAMLAEELDMNAWDAIDLANLHPRVNILRPGPGVGGHCIPVDPQFLSNANPFVTELIQTARRINERMPHFVARRVTDLVAPPYTSRKIAILGAAYKADIDDARESPTEHVDEHLRARGFTTSIYDPLVRSFCRPLAATIEEALDGADAVLLMTDHRAFVDFDPAIAASLVRSPILVDTRNALDRVKWAAAGFDCSVLGHRRDSLAAEAVA